MHCTKGTVLTRVFCKPAERDASAIANALKSPAKHSVQQPDRASSIATPCAILDLAYRRMSCRAQKTDNKKRHEPPMTKHIATVALIVELSTLGPIFAFLISAMLGQPAHLA